MEKYIKPSITVDHEQTNGIFPIAAIAEMSAAGAAAIGATMGLASKDMFTRNINGFKLQTT